MMKTEPDWGSDEAEAELQKLEGYGDGLHIDEEKLYAVTEAGRCVVPIDIAGLIAWLRKWRPSILNEKKE